MKRLRPIKSLADFLTVSPIKKLSKGEVIVYQEENMPQTYVVKSGVIRCYDISLDGNQQLISLVPEGDIFPVLPLLEADETARFFYSAFVDSEVYVVNRWKLTSFLKANPDTLLEVYTDITRRFADLQYRVNAVSKPKAREKILHTLAFIADRFKGYRREDRQVEVSLPLTHQDIADLVGLTRETTTTTLRLLRKEGLVEYDKKHFLIRRDKIQELLW